MTGFLSQNIFLPRPKGYNEMPLQMGRSGLMGVAQVVSEPA
jgi:hypothetical protein